MEQTEEKEEEKEFRTPETEEDKYETDEIKEDSKPKEDVERRKREDAMTFDERQEFRERAQELKKEGNNLYIRGDQEDAIRFYQEALEACPYVFKEDRSVLHSNIGASHLKQGLKEQSIQDCSTAIELNPSYLKALLRRANVYEELDKPHEALEDFKRILEYDPKQAEALSAVCRLPDKVKEKDEKLKAEMFDNLKKLGNMVLNPFGLSTENFKLTEDPNTGGYSVNFSR